MAAETTVYQRQQFNFQRSSERLNGSQCGADASSGEEHIVYKDYIFILNNKIYFGFVGLQWFFTSSEIIAVKSNVQISKLNVLDFVFSFKQGFSLSAKKTPLGWIPISTVLEKSSCFSINWQAKRLSAMFISVAFSNTFWLIGSSELYSESKNTFFLAF